jgi:hypothetical protein
MRQLIAVGSFVRGVTRTGAAVAATVLVVGTGAAFATGVAKPGKAAAPAVIRACASTKTGVVRIAKRCRRREKRISWNAVGRQGRQGLRGPRGVAGATGAPGPKGEPGTVGAVHVTGTSRTVADGAANTTVASSAACPAGKTLLGGGFNVGGEVAKAIVTASMPSSSEANTWTASAVAISANADIAITAYAVCA